MAFAGETKEYQALDDTLMDGPLVSLTGPTPSGANSILECAVRFRGNRRGRRNFETRKALALSHRSDTRSPVERCRPSRYPLLVDVMRDYGYVDARGMGVRRKIVPQVRASALHPLEPR